MLAVSMLVFPALRDSREGTRRHVCQDNQRQLWLLVSKYAGNHGGYLPPVRPNENAGIFAARLVEAGCAEPEELAVLLVCPAAPLANEIRAGRLAIHVPTREELQAMTAADLKRVTATISPFFAYRFPQKIGNEYVYAKIDSAGHFGLDPICGDTSGDVPNAMSPNHGGSIVQILCWDGSVKSFTTCTLPDYNDDLFHNDQGMVAAGLGPRDVVLAPSNATPELRFASQER
jgi:hypothetical protein